jgi:hypothetical protein
MDSYYEKKGRMCDVHTVAAVLGMSRRRVQYFVKRGILPRAQHGQYDLHECTSAYIQHLHHLLYGLSNRFWVRGKADKEEPQAKCSPIEASQLAFFDTPGKIGKEKKHE